MTDWEKAIAHWLPEVWTPGQVCKHQIGTHCPIEYGNPLAWKWVEFDGCYSHVTHDIPCPSATPELGFRLLEAIAAKGYQYNVINYFNKEKEVRCILYGPDQNFLWSPLTSGSDPDLLTAITKAAATLAEKERS